RSSDLQPSAITLLKYKPATCMAMAIPTDTSIPIKPKGGRLKIAASKNMAVDAKAIKAEAAVFLQATPIEIIEDITFIYPITNPIGPEVLSNTDFRVSANPTTSVIQVSPSAKDVFISPPFSPPPIR